MITKNYQVWTCLLFVASIFILITILPQSYVQGSVLNQQQIGEEGTLIDQDWPNIHQNVVTDFNSNISFPFMEESAFIHPFAIVIGNCYIGEKVLVAPMAVCRDNEGTPLCIEAFSNMQDGVVVHDLETTFNGKDIDEKHFSSTGERLLGNDNRFDNEYTIFVDENVSLAHGIFIHGPAFVGNNTFVGMESLVFDAKLRNDVAVGVASTITGGVEVKDGKFVPPDSVITTQEQADTLRERVGSDNENINSAVVHVNEKPKEGYGELGITERENLIQS